MNDPFDLPPPGAPLEALVAGAMIAQLVECLYEAWDYLGREHGDAFEKAVAAAEATAIARAKNAPFDGLPEARQMDVVERSLTAFKAIFAEIRRRHGGQPQQR